MINVNRDDVDPPEINDRWRTPEILRALGIVFHNKCYLCENAQTNPEDFEVDHFNPRKENPDQELVWVNFYLACKNCNGMKPKTTPEHGYLDPCNNNENVETEIIYKLKEIEYDKPIFYASSSNTNPKVLNTVRLLTQLHYGHDSNTNYKTASLRHAIYKQAAGLISEIAKHQKAINNGDHLQEQESLECIRIYLSRYSPFTMLMRSIGERFEYQDLFD